MPAPTVYPMDYSNILPPKNNSGGLYIGNLEAAQSIETLQKHSIRAILTAAKGISLNHPRQLVPHNLNIPATDHQSFDLSPFFDRAADFIHQQLQTTNIMVHCLAGVSRSVSLVIAYMIKHLGLSYQDAYTTIKSRRKIIHPNDGFISQLKRYQLKHTDARRSRSKSPSPQHCYSASPQRSPRKEVKSYHYSSIQDFQSRPHHQNHYINKYRSSIVQENTEEDLQQYRQFTNHKNQQHHLYRRESLNQTFSKQDRGNDIFGRIKRLSSAIVPSSFLQNDYQPRNYNDPLNSIQNKQSPSKVNTSDIDRKIEQIRKKYQQMAGNPISDYTRNRSYGENIEKQRISTWVRPTGQDSKKRQYNYLDQFNRSTNKLNYTNTSNREFTYSNYSNYPK